jgi:class 3 adenylate cyclase/tetratricopeptide (TPR) repeat protein
VAIDAHRKVVTVLFCDVVGSTALGESVDPEALQGLLAGYFERMKGIVESHGGSVEKFIGDAVMAVFGVPVAHEDDALRACRAAVEMRGAIPDLGIRGRIGVNTGEVVTGTEERLATGDAVNVAARLEQAAEPGEVLLGVETMRLVGDAVDAESVEPLAMKGKRDPVSAFRLIRVGEAPERLRSDTFVGRERELDQIVAAWARAGAEQRCELVTIVADAGVGKTRLAAEALARLDTRVVRARCLSYGEGITYWPVVEVVKQLAARPSDPAAASAIASLLRETESGTSAEEIAWAFRRLLEEQAPLVCLFEDIHWGEETFLDLVEHVALLSAGSQVLLLGTARPELLERRSSWPVAVRLTPLDQGDVDRLLPASLPTELRERITRASGGNPLFVTEMVAMAESTEGEVIVPPNLRALLTARLDQIDPAERRVLERGAIEGEAFHRGAVQALAPEEPQVTARLAALVRRELVRPDIAQIPSEDGFRFRHLLIRDAAYDALPKSVRAELHVRFAGWLEQHGRELVGLDEILGYHLEQAVCYRRELGQPFDELAARARERLTLAGERALARMDYAAAIALLARAVELLPYQSHAVNLELDLVDALFFGGQPAAIELRTASLAARACAAGDRCAELRALLNQEIVRMLIDADASAERLGEMAAAALRELGETNDDLALYDAYHALTVAAHTLGRNADKIAAGDRAAQHAQRAGDARRATVLTSYLANARCWGETPAEKGLAWIDAQEAAGARHPAFATTRSQLLSMRGRLQEARSVHEEHQAHMEELGATAQIATGLTARAQLEWVGGDSESACHWGTKACERLEATGHQAVLSTYAARLGHPLCALGRYEEAEQWAEKGHSLGAEDDLATQIHWRLVQAKVLAHRHELNQAEQLAREALALTSSTDWTNDKADAHVDLALVLEQADRYTEAAAALGQAIELYEAKGNVATAARARAHLQRLAALR